MFELKHECKIVIENIPIPWMPSIELFYPDLPQFPIMYINTYIGEDRLIACPVSVNYEVKEASCNAVFLVLTNVDADKKIIDKIGEELSERIGLANKISKEDVLNCCNSDGDYLKFFDDLWDYVEKSYGQYIPFGKFYEEIYSIVRFVSAWQPKTGKQSEMRMLYNFMSAFGEEAQFPHKWEHLEFYVIPNLSDLLKEEYDDFPKFSVLVGAMKKLFSHYFTEKVNIQGATFQVMKNAWKQNKEDFINHVSLRLFASGELTVKEKASAERLVDAFNRHAWRAAYFISAFMNAKEYVNWKKHFFLEFYERGSALKGYSEKVIACFLQQGFGNSEIIPIDTWIETFYSFPLGIACRSDFYNNFSNLGKLERVIWLSSQANKTNMKNFFNLLWCQRYGVTGNGQLRGINPIACYRCALKNTCVGLKKSYNKKILLKNNPTEPSVELILKKQERIDYICILENGVPKKAFIPNKKGYAMVDEFSGYILGNDDKIDPKLIKKEQISMKEFIDNK